MSNALRTNLRKIRRYALGVIGLLIMLSFMILAIFAPVVAPHSPNDIRSDRSLLPPVRLFDIPLNNVVRIADFNVHNRWQRILISMGSESIDGATFIEIGKIRDTLSKIWDSLQEAISKNHDYINQLSIKMTELIENYHSGASFEDIEPYLAGVTHIVDNHSESFPLGTDNDGVCILSKVIYGSRTAFEVGVMVILISLFIGLIVGYLAGYLGKWVDEVLMRATDVVMSFPGILLAIFIIAITEEPSMWSLIIALSATGWVSYARVIRGQMLSLKEREFILAARSLGVGQIRLFILYFLPNLLAPIAVQSSFGLGATILSEAGLSFLGLGPQNSFSWGKILDESRRFFYSSTNLHFTLAPGIAILLMIMAANFVGDALRDYQDKKID